MGRDDLHGCWLLLGTQDRTVEQMWNSSMPHFSDFKILSIDTIVMNWRCKQPRMVATNMWFATKDLS